MPHPLLSLSLFSLISVKTVPLLNSIVAIKSRLSPSHYTLCFLLMGIFCLSACSSTPSVYNEIDEQRLNNEAQFIDDLTTIEGSSSGQKINENANTKPQIIDFRDKLTLESRESEASTPPNNQIEQSLASVAEQQRLQRLFQQRLDRNQTPLNDTDTNAAAATQQPPDNNVAAAVPQGQTIISEELLTDEQIDAAVARALLGLPNDPSVPQSSAATRTAKTPITTVHQKPVKTTQSTPNNGANVLVQAVPRSLINNQVIVSRNAAIREKLASQDNLQAHLATDSHSQNSTKTRIFKRRFDGRCNQNQLRVRQYNTLSSLAITCGWRLSYIAKLNGLIAQNQFNPQQLLFLPPALFTKQATNTTSISKLSQLVQQPERKIAQALDCSNQTGNFENFRDFATLAAKCNWNNRRVMLLNQYTPDAFLQIRNTKLILPPFIDYLRQSLINDSIKNTQVSINPSQNQPQATVAKVNTRPEWCNLDRVDPAWARNTIAQIAKVCHFDARLLALYNGVTINQALSKDINLPASIIYPQTKKQYKIPINTNVCKQKFYRVEFGASISKLAVTCDWGFTSLLKLNALKRSSLLKIGQRLTLPPALHVDTPTITPASQITEIITDTQSQQQNLSETDRYVRACDANIYRFKPRDNLLLMAQICEWELGYITMLNEIDTSLSPIQIPEYILLPNAIREGRLRLQNSEAAGVSGELVTADSLSHIRSCIAPKYRKASGLNDLILSCGWNKELIYRLNNSSVILENDAGKNFYSPLRIFEKIPDTKQWHWPVKDANIIEPVKRQLKLVSTIDPRVFASKLGIVAYKKSNKKGDLTIAILHADGLVSIYQNLKSTSVSPGFWVDDNQLIGEVDTNDNGLLFTILNHNGVNQIALNYLSP